MESRIQNFLEACASNEAGVRFFINDPSYTPDRTGVLTAGLMVALEAGRWSTAILLINSGADPTLVFDEITLRAVASGDVGVFHSVSSALFGAFMGPPRRVLPPPARDNEARLLWTSILQDTPLMTATLEPINLFPHTAFVTATLARFEHVESAYIQNLFLFVRGDLAGLQRAMRADPDVVNLHAGLGLSVALSFSANEEFIHFVIDNSRSVDSFGHLALYLAVIGDRPDILARLLARTRSPPDDLLIVAVAEESDATAAFLVQSNYPYEDDLREAIEANDSAMIAALVDAGISPRALNDTLVPILLDAINENEEVVPIVRSLLVRDLAGLHRHPRADVRAAAQRELATLARLHQLVIARQGRYAEPGIAVAILEAMGSTEDVRYARDLFKRRYC